MKTKIIIISSLTLLFSCAEMTKVIDEANEIINTSTSPAPLTNTEVIKGLKNALTIGTNNSSALASKLDGFYKNPAIAIPFPKEAIKVKEKLEALGMKKQVDDFVLTLNRAAEAASKEAAPIFTDAIKSMSISDGFSILKGNNNAATEFLKNKTSSQLKTKFTPSIKNAIAKVNVTKYWNPLINTYNKIPLIEKMNPNLEDYITTKTMDGLFLMIEKEEQKIRKDPLARVTDILKRVFS